MEQRKSLQTERLEFREMREGDIPFLSKLLKDPIVMEAYEHPFSDVEVEQWLSKQILRYHNDNGLGLLIVLLKNTSIPIGQCGITLQDYNGRNVHEIGYLFLREYWHQGYATEAAVFFREYAFNELKLDEIFSIIRENNKASINVAMRVGMSERDRFTKFYYNTIMPHIVFSVKRADR